MNKRTVPLNIVMSYPVYWNRYRIFRDYVQNFYDSVDMHDWKEKFHYSYNDSKLSMWVENVTFSYEWLLHIGASTKTGATGRKGAAYICNTEQYNDKLPCTSEYGRKGTVFAITSYLVLIHLGCVYASIIIIKKTEKDLCCINLKLFRFLGRYARIFRRKEQ